jgi:hypothetical protein
MMKAVWTEYLKYKAKLRGFDLAKIENASNLHRSDISIWQQGGVLLSDAMITSWS